jgi:Gene product 88
MLETYMNLRKILALITETSKEPETFASGMRVQTLRQFVDDAHKHVDEELDEESPHFLGATTRKLDDEELKAYLDRILSKEKDKSDKYKLPYIHGGNIPIVDENDKKYDLDALRKEISTRPEKILKQNEKMQHSDGSSTIYFNVGLPALKGLAVNEQNGDFVVVDTCPKAGQCKVYCYAMKGGYVQWKGSSMSQTRLLNYLLNDPDGFMSKMEKEIKNAEKKFGKKNTKVAVRWHDAGDFFSPQYLSAAYTLARKYPDVDFYAYTKIADVALGPKPTNFLINFSMGSQPSEERQIDYKEVKHSKVVPKELFNDLVIREKIPTGKINKKTGKPLTTSEMKYKDTQSINALKQRLAAKYSIDPKSILTYDEMMKKPDKKGLDNSEKYNVIVKPGEGDDSANRHDVLGTYLLFH